MARSALVSASWCSFTYWIITADAPAISGQAMDVPLMLAYWLPGRVE